MQNVAEKARLKDAVVFISNSNQIPNLQRYNVNIMNLLIVVSGQRQTQSAHLSAEKTVV